MKIEGVVDHLFRHHQGKMISTLTRIYGLSNLVMIEDAIQDTFISAMIHWKTGIPDNPEGWLTAASKNRAIDLLRKVKSDDNRILKLENGPAVISINEMFLPDQIEDNQLRMIFTACHPKLNPKDQIAFALKTIAGFSDKEIGAALLLKYETVKKRLARARKTIQEQKITFEVPEKKEIASRIKEVHQVLYLIFNEGFHSTKKDQVVRKDLCGEAMRLCTLLLRKEHLRSGEGYALFGLFCFHAARLDAKVDGDRIIDLKNQDRSKWEESLITVGHNAMYKSMQYDEVTRYYIEAAIAAEHTNAKTFEDTNWDQILKFHLLLHKRAPSDFSAMNIAIVLLQLGRVEEVKPYLALIDPQKLENRAYLYYGIKAEYHIQLHDFNQANQYYNLALQNVTNESERKYIDNKKSNLIGHI